MLPASEYVEAAVLAGRRPLFAGFHGRSVFCERRIADLKQLLDAYRSGLIRTPSRME